MYSSLSYNYFIDELKARNSKEDVEKWFRTIDDPMPNIGIVYNADIIKFTFNEWIKSNV